MARTAKDTRKPRGHIYFLGIGGTLMGSLAQLAKQSGYRVSGSDSKVYPPMSDQLAAADIEVFEGFDAAQLKPAPDLVIVGNAGLPRGHPGVEYVLESGVRYTSGAQWLGDDLLFGRWVLGVAGTHGKTTTASMLAWILEFAGLEPGYLIGGVPKNFTQSARLGNTPFFVVEADEYDTSYFDRRSKFVHYRPRSLIINNLEYDHADIFPDLAAIQTQFHHLLRAVPGDGLVITPSADDNVAEVIHQGCWSTEEHFGAAAPQGKGGKGVQPRVATTGNAASGNASSGNAWWHAELNASDGSSFAVNLRSAKGETQQHGTVNWPLLGNHNVDNALAAIAAARHAGVAPAVAVEALNEFQGVTRRMDLIADTGNVRVYDDFAHHPTAIRTTLQGLRNSVGSEEIVAVVEPRSHTMSLGTLRHELTTCCAPADEVLWFRGDNIKWDLSEVVQNCVVPARQFDDLDKLMDAIAQPTADAGTAAGSNSAPKRRHVVIMSNGSFGGIYKKLPPLLS